MTELDRIRNLSVPCGPIDCVLDTDAYNEIDDQFAIALMLKSEKCHVKALYAAPFFNENSSSPEDGMERSYVEIHKLLALMENKTLKDRVYRGSRSYLTDEVTPVESDAARHLASLAMEYTVEQPLYVVAIGAITNVASAILMNPQIAERMVVVWLGGHDIAWPDTKEFNMMQDVAAARVVFGCGVPVVQLPCFGVVSAFYSTKPELEYWLRGKNALCDYLCDHTIEAAESYAAGKVWSRVIWDVTAVAWLLNDDDRFMTSVLESIPIPEYDHHYGFDPRRPFYRRVSYIKRDELMGYLFEVLAR